MGNAVNGVTSETGGLMHVVERLKGSHISVFITSPIDTTREITRDFAHKNDQK
jgi:hypothetical protein